MWPIRTFALLCVWLSACSTAPLQEGVDERARHGDVSGELVEAGEQERYALEHGVSYDQPTAYGDNPDPEYPAALLPKALAPVVVTIRIVVDGEGSVIDIDPIHPAEGADYALFLDSVRAAVSRWKFFPLVRVANDGRKSVVTAGGLSTTYNGTATRLPFTQHYRFTFSQVSGIPNVVGSGSRAPR